MKCSACHSAHGAEENVLKAITINDLCYECHTDKQGPFLYEHAPVEEDCDLCHDVHGTIANNLLKQKEPFLCLRCYHGHKGFDGEGSHPTLSSMMTSCTQCHSQIHPSALLLMASTRAWRVSWAMNKERVFLFTSGSTSYYITGVKFDRSEMICMGNAFDHEGKLGAVHFCMLPSVYRDDEYWLYDAGDEKLEFFTRKSTFSKWFNNVEVTHKRCAVISAWGPAKEPFVDNVLFVGDTCWFAEAENTGALLSGHKAAHAVCKALHTGKANREGVVDYIEWWKRNWPETHNYKDFLC